MESKSDEKKRLKLQKELERLELMNEFEGEAYSAGINLLAGMDEVGRGPLAGPVVACAVILPRKARILGVNDSKKLSEKKREELYDIIMEQAIAIGIGCVSPEKIDEINILQATYLAMSQALESLSPQAEHVLVDGNPVNGIKIPQTAIVKGDSKSMLIACASIIAKVYRDRMMRDYHEFYPQYGFLSNKGYGTKEHMRAIKDYGLTPIHRKSFTKSL